MPASAPQREVDGQPSDELAMSSPEDVSAAQPEPAARPVSAGRISAGKAPDVIETLIARHAGRFDLPAGLVRRVAWRESKFDPKQRNGPYWGLMQIRLATARSLGFRGEPAELLDADTNMTYAVAYLANAYRVAGRNERRAEALYAKGYYYEAKRKGMLGALIKTASVDE
jgi:soluble lytic murein transglycosylase-like protein